MLEILLASRSGGKLHEIRLATSGSGIEWCSLDEYPDIAEAVEDGNSFRENALIKCTYYSKATGLPALADDSGLIVDALGGDPGVHSAHYAGIPRDNAANNQKLLAALRGVPEERRTARFHCHMVFCEGDNVLAESTGEVEGRILDAPRGRNGFGYDPLFFIPSLGKTAAELTDDEKNRVSHRGIALRKILPNILSR